MRLQPAVQKSKDCSVNTSVAYFLLQPLLAHLVEGICDIRTTDADEVAALEASASL